MTAVLSPRVQYYQNKLTYVMTSWCLGSLLLCQQVPLGQCVVLLACMLLATNSLAASWMLPLCSLYARYEPDILPLVMKSVVCDLCTWSSTRQIVYSVAEPLWARGLFMLSACILPRTSLLDIKEAVCVKQFKKQVSLKPANDTLMQDIESN